MTASIIYSIFIFYGMFTFAGAALLFMQFKNQLQPYVSSWIIGLVLMGVGTMLVALKELVPEFIAYKLGNSLNIASYIYVYYSYKSLLGKTIRFNWIALEAFLVAIFFAITLVLVSNNFGQGYQPAVVALCGLAFNFYTGLLAVKFYQKRKSTLAFALAAIFLLTALVWGIRCLMVLLGNVGFAFEGGQLNIIFFIFLLVLGISKYLFFSSLVTLIEWDEKNWLITKNNEITDLLKEKERLINGLLKANKTSVTGALSASIAHELNQPLGASNLNIQFLRMQLEKGTLNLEVGKEILDSLEADNQRAATIVKSLRTIFTEGNSNAKEFQLGDLIANVLNVIQPELKSKNIQIQLRVEGDFVIKVNSSEIEQVVLNLMNNAVDALTYSGTLQRRIAIEAMKAGKLVQLSISDNGTGISPEFKPELFEILSTTKQAGMGLGLWLCRHIITRYGGSIYYDDVIGGGAKFVVELPLAA
jgi:signal transduction histidine kinase